MTLWTVPLLPVLCGLLVAAFGPDRRAALAWLGAGVAAATLILAAFAVATGWTADLDWGAGLGLSAGLVPISAVLALLVPTVAGPVIVHAALSEHVGGLPRLVGLLLVFTGGMLLVVVANDLLTLLIGWEIIGATSWALIAHEWRDRNAPQSGLYAFVVTRAGDLGLFVALMALWSATGSTSYAAIGSLDGWPLTLVAWGIAVAALSKAGQIPFSPWLFRAMAGPSSVSALLHAATLVAAGAYLAARLAPDLSAAPGWNALLIGVGLATVLAGSVVAILQEHAKKLLAASTSAQLGFMFVAIGAGYPGIAVLHLAAHAFLKAPLFLSAGLAGHRAGSYALGGMRLGRALPVTAALTTICAAALAGLPPLGAAWTKEEIVSAAGQAGWPLAALVMLGGGLSAAYALRFVWLAYGPGQVEDGDEAETNDRLAFEHSAEWLPLGVLALATPALGLLWLPDVGGVLVRAVGAVLPGGSGFETAATLATVALGLIAGTWLVRNQERVMLARSERVADWLGLPWLIDWIFRAPADHLALWAAAFDNTVLDAPPRAAGWIARRGVIWLARADDRAVDAGVRGAGRLGDWLAGMSDRFGEAAADGLPLGTARLVAMGGRDLRELQTGMAHHYYLILAGGLAVAAGILLAF